MQSYGKRGSGRDLPLDIPMSYSMPVAVHSVPSTWSPFFCSRVCRIFKLTTTQIMQYRLSVVSGRALLRNLLLNAHSYMIYMPSMHLGRASSIFQKMHEAVPRDGISAKGCCLVWALTHFSSCFHEPTNYIQR